MFQFSGSADQTVGAFLDVKRERGSTIERALYASMTPPQLLTRMLARRPLVFYTGADYTYPSGNNKVEYGAKGVVAGPATLEGYVGKALAMPCEEYWAARRSLAWN